MSQSPCLVLLFSALAITVVLPYSGRAEPKCVESHTGGDDPGQYMTCNPSADTADSIVVDNVARQAGYEGDREDKDDKEGKEGREVETNTNKDVEDEESLGWVMDLFRLVFFMFISLCFN
ncbi:hypothetical protein BD779DRAFT_296479 [Infundibulicybe gibba]|nr:hypothetical protein BD779DRAFT_296479 [Infundibulicybe gibba]